MLYKMQLIAYSPSGSLISSGDVIPLMGLDITSAIYIYIQMYEYKLN